MIGQNRTPIAEEELWEYHRPRDSGNRSMGPSPVTHLVLEGMNVPQGHVLRTVNTRKGKTPTAPAYVDRTNKGWARPRTWDYECDWTACREMLDED